MKNVNKTKNVSGNPVCRFRIDSLLLRDWENYCQESNTSSAEELRSFIRSKLAAKDFEVLDSCSYNVIPNIDGDQKKRIEVRFTKSEFDALTERSDAELISRQRWIVNCVRASLTHEPQFTLTSIKALWESSYQLRSIGRNLNQIAKRLNANNESSISIKYVENLKEVVNSHCNIVSTVLDQSISRWIISNEK